MNDFGDKLFFISHLMRIRLSNAKLRLTKRNIIFGTSGFWGNIIHNA